MLMLGSAIGGRCSKLDRRECPTGNRRYTFRLTGALANLFSGVLQFRNGVPRGGDNGVDARNNLKRSSGGPRARGLVTEANLRAFGSRPCSARR
jgi:hypothetical protein